MAGIQSPAWPIGAKQHTATLVRRAQQGFLGGTGVVGSGLVVTAVSGKLEVKVAPGELYIPGTLGNTNFPRVNAGTQHATFSSLPEDFTSQGTYYTYLPEVTNLVISTPSSVHERIDLVVVNVEDAEYSGSLNQAVMAIVAGTPEASPKPPVPPASCVVLAEIKVPISASEIKPENVVSVAPFVSLLSPVVASANITAKPGQHVTTGATLTVTLPSPSTGGQFVSVFSGGSGAAVTTVTSPSGAIIGDFSSSTSVKLAYLQHLLVYADGTGNWLILAGEPKGRAVEAGTSTLGFYGTTPIAKQTVKSNPTTNELRTALANLGLVIEGP